LIGMVSLRAYPQAGQVMIDWRMIEAVMEAKACVALHHSSHVHCR
jgi:hypothetical protein